MSTDRPEHPEGRAEGQDSITHSRICDECDRETYQFERCHVCGDVPWKVVTDGGRDVGEHRVVRERVQKLDAAIEWAAYREFAKVHGDWD